MAFGNYTTTDIYLFDPYHFGEILGNSITLAHSSNKIINTDINLANQNNLREIFYPTQLQEFCCHD